jgi:hypothetical protein
LRASRTRQVAGTKKLIPRKRTTFQPAGRVDLPLIEGIDPAWVGGVSTELVGLVAADLLGGLLVGWVQPATAKPISSKATAARRMLPPGYAAGPILLDDRPRRAVPHARRPLLLCNQVAGVCAGAGDRSDLLHAIYGPAGP